MSRKLTGFAVNQANEKLEIEVTDAPGAGGANHRYEITGFDTETNPSKVPESNGFAASFSRLLILFQNGTIPENGVNGVTQEVLLAIVIDRLRGFQAGPFMSRHNAIALTKLEEALFWLQARTRERLERQVEGKHLA